MAEFLIAVEKVIGPGPEAGGFEGGLINNPKDPGGLTNFGIALNEHPELTANDIRGMTRTRAIGIYRQKYWGEFYGQIEDQRLANSLFDEGVNMGVHASVQMIQGLIFEGGGPALDGKFGPATLAAVNARKDLASAYTVERLLAYAKGDAAFHHSWFTRVVACLS